MNEDQAYIHESIINQVKMGFWSIPEIEEAIVEEITDNQMEADVPVDWAISTIKSSFAQHQKESQDWTHPTDTERLVEAFDALAQQNIIALHNAGYTTSDGESEVVEVELKLREKNIQSVGYCFYHEQDLAHAIDPGEPSLMLAFQKVNNTEESVTLAVGRIVVKALEQAGLQVNWTEDVHTKIELPNFKWQWAFHSKNRDLLGYEAVTRHLIRYQKRKSKPVDPPAPSPKGPWWKFW